MKRILCLILTFLLSMSLCTVFAEEIEGESVAENRVESTEIAGETQIDAKKVVVEAVSRSVVTDENGEDIEEDAELQVMGDTTVTLWVGDVLWLDIYNFTMGKDIQTSSISWYTNSPSEVKIMSKSWDMRQCQIKALDSTGSQPAIVSCQYREATFGSNYHYQTIDFYVYVEEYVYVSGMSFAADLMFLPKGGWNMFEVNISPWNVSNKNIQWTSSNPSVATCVTNYVGSETYGGVSAEGVGEAIITGRLGGYTDTIKVRVYNVGEKGDVNGDGRYNVADGLMVIRMGLPSSHTNYLDAANDEKTAADVNGDGRYNVADAILMIRRGLPSSHPNHLAKFPTE